MGEGVRGIYWARKQWTFSPRGIFYVLFTNGPKAALYVQLLFSDQFEK
jgi:hypothetical protein